MSAMRNAIFWKQPYSIPVRWESWFGGVIVLRIHMQAIRQMFCWCFDEVQTCGLWWMTYYDTDRMMMQLRSLGTLGRTSVEIARWISTCSLNSNLPTGSPGFTQTSEFDMLLSLQVNDRFRSDIYHHIPFIACLLNAHWKLANTCYFNL